MFPLKITGFTTFLVSLMLLFTGCNMDKDIHVDLPEYKPELVVEGYLMPGQPYRLTVFESSPYFDRPEPVVVPDATVIITHNGQADTLIFSPVYDPVTDKFYTHTSATIMQGQPGDVYNLSVADTRGRRITGSTTIIPPVTLDSLEPRFNADDEALLLMKFQDKGGQQDYYRVTIHRKKPKNHLDRDYYLDDELNDGKQIVLGTSYRYNPDDTLYVALYHMEKQHYTFLRSADDASSANGNPFGQPASLKSSVQGGLGIFTNLAVSRDSIIIRK